MYFPSRALACRRFFAVFVRKKEATRRLLFALEASSLHPPSHHFPPSSSPSPKPFTKMSRRLYIGRLAPGMSTFPIIYPPPFNSALRSRRRIDRREGKEGKDDPADHPSSLLSLCLNLDATRRDIETFFDKFGTMTDVRIMNGFGFVEFENVKVSSALSSLPSPLSFPRRRFQRWMGIWSSLGCTSGCHGRQGELL